MDVETDQQDGRAAPSRPIATVVVVTGAAPLHVAGRTAVPAGAFVIAADGGLDHALEAGLEPHELVGDLDSVSPAGLEWAAAHAHVERHPTDKASTDTELAVARAASLAPQRLILVAGRGDRLDHAVAAIGTLGSDALAAVPVVEGWWGDDHVLLARPGRPVVLADPPGCTFSVLALHGDCRGVSITGARWPLADHDLRALVGTGVSNQVDVPPARIAVTDGVATVIVPGAIT